MTTKMKMALSFLTVAAMVGCNPGRSNNDTGVSPGGDAGTPAVNDTGTARDVFVRPDAHTVSSDTCSAEAANATSTLGCNGGFASTTPAANTAGGTCTGGGEAAPAGTCTGSNAFCSADADMPGVCFVSCEPGDTYITTGGCPTGFRCFDLEGEGTCFQDCDATHACPTGQECDGEGSCVPSEG